MLAETQERRIRTETKETKNACRLTGKHLKVNGRGSERRSAESAQAGQRAAPHTNRSSVLLFLGWNVLFGCLCRDMCLSATGEAYRACKGGYIFLWTDFAIMYIEKFFKEILNRY